MGVPKFFRYTSERYPCLNELVKQYQIPEFDNMYLDMNGIIHNCSHPDDSNPHFRITEEKIFADIFHYLSILFQIIKPKKLFFMAIDGVAPRAKMNQQRGRRFRSAREAEMLEEKAKKNGEKLPSEKRFDSNCITPGTVFMARLHEQLRYFVKQKISSDPLWRKCKVILSGHETPGEGEHKIMDYIRWSRSQPDYDPDTRHCLYGLDADLIMLGMCTHEPHFALLREEVKFGKSTQRVTSPEETNFYLLHLSLMRDYLEQEFLPVKDKLSFEWDLEKIIDDWVLMGFLVGNDFIPNLPNMHISNDALPLLYKTYMAVLPTLDGYINETGILNLDRFETFMQELAKIDKEAFQENYVDLRYFEEKTGRRPNYNERKEYKPNNDETFNVNVDDIKSSKNDDLQALINATDDLLNDIDDEDAGEWEDLSDEEANFAHEFILHKEEYYMNKLDYAKVTPEVLASQAEGYVRAIQWNLHYYYRGCASWCWYYPHHYAPFVSDIKGFKDFKIEFELGVPFKPFEQLLAVLPAASKSLLPEPFHHLMTDDESPIFDYYPINFETDLNGKKNDWEAVVLIPFIDEKRLLESMKPCYGKLTPEEIKRNTHGPMLVYNYSQQPLGPLIAPEYFPEIPECRCSETPVWRNELDVPPERLRCGALPGAHTQFYYPGFPTLKHVQYKTYLKKNKCRVFDQPSRNDNMIVELVREEKEPPLEVAANRLLGRVVWVGWPHLTQARVISVSDEKQRFNIVQNTTNGASKETDEGYIGYEIEQNFGNLHKQWLAQRSTVVQHNMDRMGLELGDVNILVHAVNLRGYKYVAENNTTLAVEQVWCEVPCGYAYQAVLKEVKHKSTAIRRNALPQEVFPQGAEVFLMTGPPYYGCLAQVVSAEEVGRSGRIKVHVSAAEEPRINLSAVYSNAEYRPANHVAASVGITSQLLSRLTGCVFVVLGDKNNRPTEQQNKLNIGLNLKFNKKNQEVTGYTRRCPTTNTWLYSTACQKLLSEYIKTFPDVIDSLSHSLGNDVFFEGELWPGQVGEKKPHEVSDWLKRQPHTSAARRDCGSEALEPEQLLKMAEDIDRQLASMTIDKKKVTLQVKIGLLYMPSLHEGNIPPDPLADFQMLDRVVCVANNLTVPMGAKGTITAIYRPSDTNTVRLSDKLNSEASYQILFDETFPGAMGEEKFTTPRFYRLSGCHLLNISYGRKIREAKNHIAAPDSFQILMNNKPTQLRTDDGHHSAFASYSPTKERHTPNNVAPVQSSVSPQETSTELLKSLLKISEPANSGSPSTNNTNWRQKTDPPPQPKSNPVPQNYRQPQLQNVGTQQNLNWRSGSVANPPNVAMAPRSQLNWNPTLLHNNMGQFNNQHAVSLMPRFAQAFPAPPPAPMLRPPIFSQPPPQPNLIPPHFMISNKMNEPPPRQFMPPFPPPHPGAIGGSQESQQPAPRPPFVPLQVVTKQRRTQKPSAPTINNRTNAAGNAEGSQPDKQPPAPHTAAQANNQSSSEQTSRPRRKPKSRIAANLPNLCSDHDN